MMQVIMHEIPHLYYYLTYLQVDLSLHMTAQWP